jgi:hypothetical protein
MKTALASALVPAAAITALIHATPAAATPDTPSTETACGTTLESWMRYTLEGEQLHNTSSFSYETRINIGPDGIANWKLQHDNIVHEANGHDRVWIEGNSARFRSDKGRGTGEMFDFTLHSPTCKGPDVFAAYATTHIPVAFGVDTYATRPGVPLRPAP